MTNDSLPPLPEPDTFTFLTANTPVYTADQMREYAREAIAESEAESMPKAWMAGKARAYEEMSQTKLPWRGIESAPKDGTRIIVACADGVSMISQWVNGWGWPQIRIQQMATHWMPLPPLPEVKP